MTNFLLSELHRVILVLLIHVCVEEGSTEVSEVGLFDQVVFKEG